MPSKTSCIFPPRVIALNLSGTKVSKLTLIESIPAAANSSPCFSNKVPLVVSVTSSIPSISLIPLTNAAIFFRTKGSPPVSLIFFTPRFANILHTLSISS